MSAVWDEVKRLAADFQRAQLSSTVQRLSERNCIEIVKKLIELELLDVIFTNDGKEYLTPFRLLKEIKDELIVSGGRINLVDLAEIIKVDYNHIEAKASELVQIEPNVKLVLGQLITNEYLDQLAEEINEKLSQSGEINVAELVKIYDLPPDFLEKSLHERLGTIIQGLVDSSDSRTIFTESYLTQNKARIRGVLSAITRPIPVSSLINHFKFPEKLFFNVVNDLIAEERIAGTLSAGRSERAIYLPDIYAKSQNEWVDSFYRQNGYLEYDALVRLGIQDPKSYIRKKFSSENITHLASVCVGKNILNQIEASVEEALNMGGWVDIMPLLPSVFNSEDCRGIINAITKSITKQGSVLHVFCNTILVTDDLIKSSQESFESVMTKKAEEDIAKNPQWFLPCQPMKVNVKKESNKEKQEQKDDQKKEDKKKKHVGSKSGHGTRGREIKVRAVKKKFPVAKDAEESGSDDDSFSSSKDPKANLTFLNVEEIKIHLKTLEAFKESFDDFILEIAHDIHRPLTKRYEEVAKAAYLSLTSSSAGNRRKQHADYQEKFSSLLNHIIMFEKGTKCFSGDVSTQFCKHLLKTLCTDLVNMIVNYLSLEHGLLSSVDTDATLTSEVRLKLINRFNEELKQPLLKLHKSLNENALEEYLSTAQVVLGAGICDMIFRKPDKKKERLILANHRQSLLSQLNEAADPALCLHLAVLLVFQSHTHCMLHASGKFVPQIISFLQKQVPSDASQLLTSYQEAVMRKLVPKDGEENIDSDNYLEEHISVLKDLATTYKKTSISESEH